MASVIPLRLTRGAFAVYLQLTDMDRKSTEKVKEALVSAFAIDPFMAYEQFAARKLRNGESPDVFLAELRRLASLFGGMSDKGLASAFMAGLPENVRQLLRAGSRMESLDLSQILTRARAVIKDDCSSGSLDACLGAVSESGAALQQSQHCYESNGLNHFARDCLLYRRGFTASSRGRQWMGRGTRRAHTTPTGSGNESGGEVSVPTSSLANH